jgi:3-mercaptopyruvate sulfurtransferase SseA
VDADDYAAVDKDQTVDLRMAEGRLQSFTHHHTPGGKMTDYITVEELRQAQGAESAPVIIDVRGEEEYAAGHIPGALHIPADELEARLDEIPKGRPVAPY